MWCWCGLVEVQTFFVAKLSNYSNITLYKVLYSVVRVQTTRTFAKCPGATTVNKAQHIPHTQLIIPLVAITFGAKVDSVIGA